MKFGKKKEKESVENIEKDKDKDKEIKEKEKKEKKSNKKKNQEVDNSNNNINNSKRVFGGSLPFLYEEELPTILVQTIEYLEQFGLETAGIFRENGSLASIQSYRSLYDNDKPVNFPPHEAHVVASLLKAYLRELKVPLCTFEHYDMFIACESVADEKVKVELLKKVIAHLPPYNRKVMKYIFSFLQKVVENSNINKMTPDALSIVFLPTILRPQANTDLEVLQFTVEDSKSTKTLMSSILLNYDDIFDDPNLFQPRTRQTRAQTDFVSPPSSQNSTTSSYLSSKNPISPRSPIGSSPNFTTASILSALPPPPISPILSSNTANTSLPPPPPIMSSSIDDNNEPSLSPRIITPAAPPTTTHHHHIPPSNPIPPTPTPNNQQSQHFNIPPPLPDKNKCKLLPISSPTINSESNKSEPLPPTTPTSVNIPTLSIPAPTPFDNNNNNASPISPTKNQAQLPTLPPKPPSLVLPPKPIPKIPTMFEYENNVRQRSNTTMV
ncbi:hypothetical protein RB653_006347 [Dictyostelium firmibasis]|uniref:Rho-GAP domain-containing protein n=1 Tax=Dictyostelium firmibasis TaxID=79012 RepID=A0AAN7UEC1_9MYCE